MPMETITEELKLARAGFYWRELDGVQALVSAPLEADGFANGFSTRAGGTSTMPEHALNLAGFNEDTAENILENRRRFLKLFPSQAEWALAGCWQVHGADVRLIKDLGEAKPAEDARGDTIYCDAIVSNARGSDENCAGDARNPMKPFAICVTIGPDMKATIAVAAISESAVPTSAE